MQIRIYFNDKPLFLVDELTKEMQEHLHHEDTVFIDDFNVHTVKAMIHEMEQPQINRGIFFHSNVKDLLNSFKKRLTLIQAAGGLVHTPDNYLLLIFRKGKWDLPKGKLDENEDLETCAVREIKEETGIKRLEVEQPLCVTYHTYHQFGKHILKESHWFLLHAENKQPLTPQTNEDIEKCEWVALSALSSYLNNTHCSVTDVLHAAKEILKPTSNA